MAGMDHKRLAREAAFRRSAAGRQPGEDSSTEAAASVVARDGVESGQELHLGEPRARSARDGGAHGRGKGRRDSCDFVHSIRKDAGRTAGAMGGRAERSLPRAGGERIAGALRRVGRWTMLAEIMKPTDGYSFIRHRAQVCSTTR